MSEFHGTLFLNFTEFKLWGIGWEGRDPVAGPSNLILASPHQVPTDKLLVQFVLPVVCKEPASIHYLLSCQACGCWVVHSPRGEGGRDRAANQVGRPTVTEGSVMIHEGHPHWLSHHHKGEPDCCQ